MKKNAKKSTPAFVSKLKEALAPKSEGGPPHVIVIARAGTGKTTTLVEGLKKLKGLPVSITPSPQQAAVWEALLLSKDDSKSVCFVAFNKGIATELQERVPVGCNAMTNHSMGYAAVRAVYPKLRVNQYRVCDIICNLLGKDPREVRRHDAILLKATEELVGLCKMNLAGGRDEVVKEYGAGTSLVTIEDEDLDQLASHYGVELNGSRSKVFSLVPMVLAKCADPLHDGCLDFDDMIWLPIVLNLPIFRYDLLLVDEAQDLNRCQQALVKKAGRRIVLCGDPKQAIYGFAGADAESMPRMETELRGTERGVAVLPLTVTRRCGKAIVAEAQKITPDFEAFETNPQGSIRRATIGEPKKPVVGPDGADMRSAADCSYQSIVEDGDFILCRVNAPLVSQCFRFLKAGRKATILGRDVGQGLISTVKKQKAVDVADLVGKLSDWLHEEVRKENAKRNPNEGKIINLQDRYDCLVCFTEGANTVDEVVAKIEAVFTDNRQSPGIRLSSIHKSKGLEARRVFLLEPKGAGVPHPMARSSWQVEQEWNLRYVAITRAIEELIFVGE